MVPATSWWPGGSMWLAVTAALRALGSEGLCSSQVTLPPSPCEPGTMTPTPPRGQWCPFAQAGIPQRAYAGDTGRDWQQAPRAPQRGPGRSLGPALRSKASPQLTAPIAGSLPCLGACSVPHPRPAPAARPPEPPEATGSGASAEHTSPGHSTQSLLGPRHVQGAGLRSLLRTLLSCCPRMAHLEEKDLMRGPAYSEVDPVWAWHLQTPN